MPLRAAADRPRPQRLRAAPLALSIAFGLVFQLPVVLWTLGLLGVVTSGWLWRNRFLVVFVPLLAFYPGATLLLRVTGR